MKVLLTTLNAKYIHKNLALRWIYQACPKKEDVSIHEFTIKDEQDRIIEAILKEPYDVICFSVYIWNIEPIQEIIKAIKAKRPEVYILVGGPEVSYESSYLLDEGVDAISVGEGEESVWEYIEMLNQRKSYEIIGIQTKDFPNTTYRKVSLDFLETLEDPYFMELDAHDMDRRYLYFETSRGCPYGCEYCLSSCDRQVRMFSQEYVLKLLEKISKSNIRQVKLLDRTFNADPKRALNIARYMNEHCPNQIFQFEIVAETLSEELLTFFEHEADKQRFRFEIGVQSFNSQTLQAVGRLQNNERLCEVIQRLRDINVTMHVDLIAGLPYEDVLSFQASFDALFALGAKEVQLGILKLLKGTKLKAKQAQYDFIHDAHAPYAVQSTKWLSEVELARISKGAEAVEKFWNSGKCRFTILQILAKGWYTSAFALFMELGDALQQLPRPYAPQHLFECFFSVLPKVDPILLCGILNMDYYGLFKQRPSHIQKRNLEATIKDQIRAFAIEHGVQKDAIYRYATIDYACFDGEIAYQIVLYNAAQSLPKRWIVNAALTKIEEFV